MLDFTKKPLHLKTTTCPSLSKIMGRIELRGSLCTSSCIYHPIKGPLEKVGNTSQDPFRLK